MSGIPLPTEFQYPRTSIIQSKIFINKYTYIYNLFIFDPLILGLQYRFNERKSSQILAASSRVWASLPKKSILLVVLKTQIQYFDGFISVFFRGKPDDFIPPD